MCCEYKKFLIEIKYLREEGPDFQIETKDVDDEITKIAGPPWSTHLTTYPSKDCAELLISLFISSQHIANWIYHGITTKIQVTEIMKEMAKVVDGQNKNDSEYIRMSDDLENSIAFKTACDLVFKGIEQPSGYTEPLLHVNRLDKKSSLN